MAEYYTMYLSAEELLHLRADSETFRIPREHDASV